MELDERLTPMQLFGAAGLAGGGRRIVVDGAVVLVWCSSSPARRPPAMQVAQCQSSALPGFATASSAFCRGHRFTAVAWVTFTVGGRAAILAVAT